MMQVLGIIVLTVTAGAILLSLGFLLFLRKWAASEERKQRMEQAERVTYNRIMSASRPTWTAQRARQFNEDSECRQLLETRIPLPPLPPRDRSVSR